MPYCTNCGTRVELAAAFCPNCGRRQQVAAAPQYADFLEGMSNRTASVLCYVPVFGIVPSIVFLASQKFRRNHWVRFDAFQSLYLFVTWLIVSTALPSLLFGFPHSGIVHGMFFGLIKFAVFVCWIFLLVKAAQHQQYRLPFIGDLAARSAAEQV